MKRFIVGLTLITVVGSLSIDSMADRASAKSLRASDGARRITPADLRQLLKKGEAIVVDVRSPEVYRAGHVKGARLIPAAEIGSRADELPRDKLIATYCS